MLNCGEWPRIKLGDVLSTVTGSTPSTKNPEFYGEHIFFVKPPDLIDSYILSASDSLSELGASTGRVVPAGSVLVSCIGNLGKIGLATQSISFNQQINAIVADEKFDPKFMFYQALSPNFKLQLEKLSSGTTVSIVNKSKFNSIQIVLPPLRVQKRIVAILDEAFADIDKARELTEQNLKNTRELFESYLRVVFDEAISKFPKIAWKNVLDIRSGRNQKEVETPDGSYPIVGSAGKTMGFANAYICEAGTTIIGRKGTINNPIFMEQAFWNVDTAFGLHAGEKLNKKFLYYFCRSFDFTSRDKGSGRPSLVKKDLLEMKMPLPPLEVQKQITLKLESLELEKLKLEAIYKDKQRKIEQLRYALLANIFDDCLAT